MGMWKKSIVLSLALLALCIVIFVSAATDTKKATTKKTTGKVTTSNSPKPGKSSTGVKKAEEKKPETKKEAKKTVVKASDDKKKKETKPKEEAKKVEEKKVEEKQAEDKQDDENKGDETKSEEAPKKDEEKKDDEETHVEEKKDEKKDDEEHPEEGKKDDDEKDDENKGEENKPEETTKNDEEKEDKPIVMENNDIDPDHQKQMMQDWSNNMQDFIPSDLTSFELTGGDDMIFYEEVDTVPAKIRGAYFVTSNEKSDIDYTIVDPDGAEIHQVKDKHEGIFYFDANLTGKYQFIFSNQKFFEVKMVTFAVHVANNTSQFHQRGEINVAGKLEKIQNSINDLFVETKFSYKRQETHLETSRQTHNRVLILGVVEGLGILLTAVWQIYYIKRLLDNKRVV